MALKRFGKFYEFSNRVPVASGCGSVQDFGDLRPGESRAGLAIGKVNVEMAADDVKFFGSDIHREERFAHRWGGLVFEKCNGELGGLNSLSLGKRIARDNFTHFRDSAQQDFRTETEFALDSGFNFVGKS